MKDKDNSRRSKDVIEVPVTEAMDALYAKKDDLLTLESLTDDWYIQAKRDLELHYRTTKLTIRQMLKDNATTLKQLYDEERRKIINARKEGKRERKETSERPMDSERVGNSMFSIKVRDTEESGTH